MSHIYPGAHTLNAYLTLKNSSEAIEFYKKAFGATEKGRVTMPDGSIGHAEIEIEGSVLMMADENPGWGNKSAQTYGGSPVSLGLYVEDADAAFKRAVDAGATVVMPVSDQFYGDRSGSVMDPFGYKWSIATHKQDMTWPEMQEKSDAMFAEQK